MAKKSRFLQHDKTEKMFTSPRQEGTFLYFTSCGDDITNNIRGQGTKLLIDNSVARLNTTVIETQFIDRVFIKDGIVLWENAQIGDNITLEIVLPSMTPFRSETQQGNASFVNGTCTWITSSQMPDETWVGEYLLFPMDVVVFRFVNKFNIIGTNHVGLVLESSDAAEIEEFLKFRFTLDSPNGSDIKILINLELYRENTI